MSAGIKNVCTKLDSLTNLIINIQRFLHLGMLIFTTSCLIAGTYLYLFYSLEAGYMPNFFSTDYLSITANIGLIFFVKFLFICLGVYVLVFSWERLSLCLFFKALYLESRIEYKLCNNFLNNATPFAISYFLSMFLLAIVVFFHTYMKSNIWYSSIGSLLLIFLVYLFLNWRRKKITDTGLDLGYKFFNNKPIIMKYTFSFFGFYGKCILFFVFSLVVGGALIFQSINKVPIVLNEISKPTFLLLLFLLFLINISAAFSKMFRNKIFASFLIAMFLVVCFDCMNEGSSVIASETLKKMHKALIFNVDLSVSPEGCHLLAQKKYPIECSSTNPIFTVSKIDIISRDNDKYIIDYVVTSGEKIRSDIDKKYVLGFSIPSPIKQVD